MVSSARLLVNALSVHTGASWWTAPPCSGPILYGADVVIQNAYPGEYLLERNGQPRFTRSGNRVRNSAAVWKLWRPNYLGEGAVRWGDEIIIENQYAGNYMLQRNGPPRFTTNRGRIDNKAAVWKLENGQVGEPLMCNSLLKIVNQYPGHYKLERHGHPSFTTRARQNNADQWTIKPVCGEYSVVSAWVPFTSLPRGHSLTLQSSFTTSSSTTNEQTESRKVGTSMSYQYTLSAAAEIEGVGSVGSEHQFGVTISNEHTTTARVAVTEALSETVSRSRTFDTCDQAAGGTVWKFTATGTDSCSRTEIVTNEYVITANQAEPPCCAPGLFQSVDNPHGECIEGVTSLCHARRLDFEDQHNSSNSSFMV